MTRTSLLPSGNQLLIIFVSMLTLGVLGVFYPYGRGTMYAAIIVIYCVTAGACQCPCQCQCQSPLKHSSGAARAGCISMWQGVFLLLGHLHFGHGARRAVNG